MWIATAVTTRLSPNMISIWSEPATIHAASSQITPRTTRPMTAALTWRFPLTEPNVVSCILAFAYLRPHGIMLCIRAHCNDENAPDSHV